MKLDDRFMTIFTVLVLILGLGALMNRGEDGTSLFGSPGSYVAQADVFTLRAGRVQSLDVLLNDANYERVNADLLEIVKAPSCGFALPVAGTIQYSESQTCEGKVQLSYCVPFEDKCDAAVVTLNILKVEKTPAAVASNGDGEPMIMVDVIQGSSPEQQPQLAMKQPVRLEMPTTAAVNIAPADAVESIRNRGDEVVVAVQAEMQIDSPIKVSRESARAGNVATGGVSLSAPSFEGENSNISVASAARPVTSAPRASAPQGFGAGIGDVAMNALPGSPSIGSPRAPSAQPAQPSQQASAQPAITSQPKPPSISSPSAPISNPSAPVVAQNPVVDSSPSAPVVTSAPAEEIAVASADVAAQPQLQVPGASDTPETSGVVAKAEDDGVLVDIARSNSILGVTVSAAKGLLSQDSNLNIDKSSANPRPRSFEVASGIGSNNFPAIESARNLPLPQIEAPVSNAAPAPAKIVASLDTGDNELVFKRISRPARPSAKVDVAPPVANDVSPNAEPTFVATLTNDVPVVPGAGKQTGAGANCAIDMSLQARVGAELVATVVSPCRPEQAFEVNHAGLIFTATTDLDGVANFIVPAMTNDAEVTVKFGDGGASKESIQVPNMDRVTRVAVMWSADIDFDLHALEFGAQTGAVGHVWAQSPSDYRAARRAGGGYMTSLGPVSGPGEKAEVYTIIESSRTQSGLIDLSLELAGFGEQCDAQPIIRTIRSEGASVERDRDIQFAFGTCAAGQQAVIKNAIQDIRIAGR